MENLQKKEQMYEGKAKKVFKTFGLLLAGYYR